MVVGVVGAGIQRTRGGGVLTPQNRILSVRTQDRLEVGNDSRGHGGDSWGEGDIVAEEVGCGEPKNERRRGFDPSRVNIKHTCSMWSDGGKQLVGFVVRSHGMRVLRWLRKWEVGKVSTSGRGGFWPPKARYRAHPLNIGYMRETTSGGRSRDTWDGGAMVVEGM